MYKKKKTGILGVIVTIVILIILVLVTNLETGKITSLENAINKIVLPVQCGLTYLKNGINGNSYFFENIDKLREENEELKQTNSELEKKSREYEIMKTENEKLKQYLNLTEKYEEYDAIAGYVINKDFSNYSKTLVINIGKKDGVAEKMTVIGDQGLVGYVLSVNDTTSKIQTIVDNSSATSCVMSSSRDSIVCKGTIENSSTLKATYIPIDASMAEGDSIETSGLGGIYKKGIHVGKIKEIIETNNVTDRYAVVEMAVDINKLETVLVIKN